MRTLVLVACVALVGGCHLLLGFGEAARDRGGIEAGAADASPGGERGGGDRPAYELAAPKRDSSTRDGRRDLGPDLRKDLSVWRDGPRPSDTSQCTGGWTCLGMTDCVYPCICTSVCGSHKLRCEVTGALASCTMNGKFCTSVSYSRGGGGCNTCTVALNDPACNP